MSVSPQPLEGDPAAADGRLTLERVAAFPRPGSAVPTRVGFAPDGQNVLYLLPAPGSDALALWAVDVATGARRRLVGPGEAERRSLAEELRRERARLVWNGVTGYAFAEDARPALLLVPQGEHALVGPPDALRPLPLPPDALDVRPFADGSRLAFLRAGEVHVLPLAGGGAQAVTRGARPGLSHGEAEFVAQEELGRPSGYWVRPDGALIAFAEVDVRHIPAYPIAHQADEHPWVEEHRYPFAGEPNARVRLGVVPAAGGEPVWPDIDLGDAYLARAQWLPDGRLGAAVLGRDQRHLAWWAWDPANGQKALLWEEEAPHWLNLSDDTRFLRSGEVLASSERDGFRHLYLRAAGGGAPRALTAGEWSVGAVVDLDEARRVVRFTATAAGNLERHVYAVSLDGGPMRRLSEEPGWHTAVFSPRHDLYVDQYSARGHAPRTVLRSADGKPRAVLHEDPGASAQALGLQVPEFVEVPAADGTPLHGALYRPPGGRAGLLPLIVAVYGGPGSQTVGERWGLTVDLEAQYLAQQGFLVFRLDNRGTANRGAVFERALHRRFGTVEVEDQVAGVRWLQAHRGADPARTGLYGWSYGGYMTLMALCRAPDVFQAGVAGAPVTDFRGYDTAYTERYMDTPAANPGGYEAASVFSHLGALRGHLLLIHGLIDENVHFRHTARLVQALVEGGKPFELAALPASRHGVRGTAQRRFVAQRTCAFLQRWLAPDARG